jgi:lysozyme family protein
MWLVRACGMPWAFFAAYHFLCLSMEFNSFLNRIHTLGALSFRHSMARPEPPMPSSPREAVRVEALRGPNSDPPSPEELPWVTYRLLPSFLMLRS